MSKEVIFVVFILKTNFLFLTCQNIHLMYHNLELKVLFERSSTTKAIINYLIKIFIMKLIARFGGEIYLIC